jgi:hypothetical protein
VLAARVPYLKPPLLRGLLYSLVGESLGDEWFIAAAPPAGAAAVRGLLNWYAERRRWRPVL